jgi:histidyl-tRNA synthetase
MRDFTSEVMFRRNYIFDTVRSAFERYGYAPIETPAMENIGTLTGKYGDEGASGRVWSKTSMPLGSL